MKIKDIERVKRSTRLRSAFRSVVLSCAAAAGTTAFGNYVKEWNADEGVGYWEDTSSWNTLDTANNWSVVDPASVDPEIAIDDWRAGNKAAEMTLKFRSAATTSDSSPFFVYNNTVTLDADQDSYGLTKGGDLEIAPSWGGNASLTVESGTYKFKKGIY